MDPTGPVARRFPLVARPRPACTPLPQRIDALTQRAENADRGRSVTEAVAVFNLAALVASDCGLPDLAHQWCHRLAQATLRRYPMGGRQAILSLEPIVNLARLRTRAGDGLGAWALLESLYQAVQQRTDITIDGIEIPASRLTNTLEAHRELRTWLWASLLSTGARALVVAGQWAAAYHHLQRHKGIGRRMLDGRQIAIIAHATARDTNDALVLLGDTQRGDPWEDAVTAFLTLLCQPGKAGDDMQHHALDAYCALDITAPGLAVFRTRLGLGLVDALDTNLKPIADLIDQAGTDGYAAREVLAHPGLRAMATERQTLHLTDLVAACGLDTGVLPDHMLADLSAALDTTERVIDRIATSASVSSSVP